MFFFLGTRGRTFSGDIALDDIQFVGCALPPVASSCPEFTCTRKSCVKNENVCDYNDDCGDNSDEKACGKAVCPCCLSVGNSDFYAKTFRRRGDLIALISNLVPRVLRLLGQRCGRQEGLWGNGIFSIFLIGYSGNNEISEAEVGSMLTLPSIMPRTSQETSAIFQRVHQVTLLVRDWRISIHLLVSAFG